MLWIECSASQHTKMATDKITQVIASNREFNLIRPNQFMSNSSAFLLCGSHHCLNSNWSNASFMPAITSRSSLAFRKLVCRIAIFNHFIRTNLRWYDKIHGRMRIISLLISWYLFHLLSSKLKWIMKIFSPYENPTRMKLQCNAMGCNENGCSQQHSTIARATWLFNVLAVQHTHNHATVISAHARHVIFVRCWYDT